jgi:hypothetical protein
MVFMNIKRIFSPNNWEVQGDSAVYDCPFCAQKWYFPLTGSRPVAICCTRAQKCDLSDAQLAKPPAPTVVQEAEKHGVEVLTDSDNWFTVIRNR